MRTLVCCAWTCYGFQQVRDAIAAAELVGITPSRLLVGNDWLHARMLQEGMSLEFKANLFAAMDKAEALIAVRGRIKDDWLDRLIAHAHKRCLIVAVWQL